MLGHSCLEGGTQLGAVKRNGVGGRRVGVVEANLDRRACFERLIVGEVICVGGAGAAGEEAGRRRVHAVEIDCAGQTRVQILRRWARAVRGKNQAGAAGTLTRGTAAGAARSAACRQRRRNSPLRAGHDSSIDAAQNRPCACAEQIGVRDVQVVAGNGDVEVVFDGQGNGVGKAQIDLAVLHQIAQPHRIHEAGLGNAGWPEHIDRVAQKTASRLGEVTLGLAQVQRLGQHRRRCRRQIGRRFVWRGSLLGES